MICLVKKCQMVRLLVVCAMILLARNARADYFVRFADGHLCVFPSSCISDMSQSAGQVSFLARDGKVYTYPTATILSIGEQVDQPLPTISSYKFNDKNNYQVVSDAVGTITGQQIDVEVAGIGKSLTASFTLSDDRAQAYVDGRPQVSKVSRMRFDHPVCYTVGYPGDSILMVTPSGDYVMEQYGLQYMVNVDFLTDHSTSVPRIDINTVGGVSISSKEVYLDAEIIIDGAGVFPSMTDSVQVQGRGNTSWSSNPDAKNPYRLKFSHKVSPLGLTKGKNWVLLANKMYGSMLTNAIGMKAASLLETDACNHIIPVDLYVNGTYKGSYNLTEKVGFSNNSVQIDDESVAALLELDNHYDEADGQKFYTWPYLIPVNIKEPEFDEGTTQLTLNIIKNRVNAFVKDLLNHENITDYIDVESAVRFLMLNDFILNYEILQPKSAFCYNENMLDEDSKFRFGPVWDFDWAFGYSTNHSYYFAPTDVDFYTNISLSHYKFFYFMRQDPTVARRCYEIWSEFMDGGLDELCEFCYDYLQYVTPSLANNKGAGLDNTNYVTQADRAVTWLRQRANDLYQTLKQEQPRPGDVNGDGEVNIDDVTILIDYLLRGDNPDSVAADVNTDGEINISDVTGIIDILLSR